MHRDHTWMHERYPLVGLRYLAAFALLVVVFVATSLPFVTRASRHAVEQRLAADHAAEQERQVQIAHERWLTDPPTALLMPGRFTHTWIVQNAPHLHPGQIPILFDETRRRG
jgi:hypothetical protein